jgi:putative tryptophan/tyrosine transport system substrate-binding protein
VDRRAFIAGALSFLTAPLAAEAQQAGSTGRVYRLALLVPGSPPRASESVGQYILIDILRQRGYVEGKNLAVERRYAKGRVEQLPALAAELVQLQPDVIVAVSPVALQAAREATVTIPIVIVFAASDPVELGVVTSLARPGGNITGVALSAGTTLAGKRLEILRQVLPRATRIAVLSNEEPSARSQAKEAEQVAAQLGVKVVTVEAKGRDYERAFATMTRERVDALSVLASSVLNSDRQLIIDLATRHRLPAIYQWREHVEAGGLMSYGSSIREIYRRVAALVERIFKGATPAELPVEQPTTFEFVINLKTAKALGLTIPPSVLARADEIIQ